VLTTYSTYMERLGVLYQMGAWNPLNHQPSLITLAWTLRQGTILPGVRTPLEQPSPSCQKWIQMALYRPWSRMITFTASTTKSFFSLLPTRIATKRAILHTGECGHRGHHYALTYTTTTGLYQQTLGYLELATSWKCRPRYPSCPSRRISFE
jgi:hypothetical protein